MTTSPYYELSVTMTCLEGSIVRLIGVVERRGFILEAIDMPLQEDKECQTIRLTLSLIDDKRDIATLQRQVERLQHIKHVENRPIEKPQDLKVAGSGA